MKIQFTSGLKDRLGQELKEVDPVKSTPGNTVLKPVTLGELAVGVLDSVFQDEATEGLKPKLRRAELIDKITEAERTRIPLELLDADRDLIKDRLARRNYPTHMTVAAVKLMDTPALEPSGTEKADAA